MGDASADYIDKAQARVEALIRRHFSRATLLILSSAVILVALFAVASLWFRVPSNQRLLTELQQSNKDLVSVAQSVAHLQEGARLQPALAGALQAVLAQAELHERALEDLRRTQREIRPEALTVLQLVGGSVLLALLGYLGLQRLQTIDTEIESLRRFMFDQIRERLVEGRDVLRASIGEEVDERFAKTKVDMERTTATFRELTFSATAEFQAGAGEATRRVEEVQTRAASVFERYSWLQSPDARGTADLLGELVSVGQAHDAAERFSSADDLRSARLALTQVVKSHLTGSPDDFHNAHTQAMQMDDPRLALELAEEGLSRFNDQYDLMADKARALCDVGRAAEAKALLADWKARKPGEFVRSWRPAVFYTKAAESGDLTADAIQEVEEVLRDATSAQPHQIRLWSTFALFEKSLNRYEKAEQIFKDGLAMSPYAQILNYGLGELLLSEGRATEAIAALERAVQTDYQEMYQHDVNQFALLCTLAQAYEAIGRADKSLPMYETLVAHPRADNHIRRYAQGRLQARTAVPDYANDQSASIPPVVVEARAAAAVPPT